MKLSKFAALAAVVLACVSLMTACTVKQPPAMVYDPAKNYAAFLVLDTDLGKAKLNAMKTQSAQEGLEIGRIEYYATGTKDFEPALKRLTESKQVSVVWIYFASIMDVSNIKQSMGKLDYAGAYRYTTDQTALGK